MARIPLCDAASRPISGRGIPWGPNPARTEALEAQEATRSKDVTSWSVPSEASPSRATCRLWTTLPRIFDRGMCRRWVQLKAFMIALVHATFSYQH